MPLGAGASWAACPPPERRAPEALRRGRAPGGQDTPLTFHLGGASCEDLHHGEGEGGWARAVAVRVQVQGKQGSGRGHVATHPTRPAPPWSQNRTARERKTTDQCPSWAQTPSVTQEQTRGPTTCERTAPWDHVGGTRTWKAASAFVLISLTGHRKTHASISTGAGRKAVSKTQSLLDFQQGKNGRGLHQLENHIHRNLQPTSHSGRHSQGLALRAGQAQRCPVPATFHPANAGRQSRMGRARREGARLSLLKGDVTLCTGIPTQSTATTKTLWNRHNSDSEAAG